MVKKIVHALYFKAGLPVLRTLPVSSTMLGPVRKKHKSLPGWLAARRRAADVRRQAVSDELRWHRAGQEIDQGLPMAAFPHVPANFARNRIHQTPTLFVACLHQARIATARFEVISPDDGIFEDLFYAAEAEGSGYLARSQILPRLPRLQTCDGTFATIATSGAGNYYHWLNDCLTRLWLLEQSGAEGYQLLVPNRLLAFQEQTLALLGFSEARLAPFGEEHWQLRQLLVPSLTNTACQSHPAACRWLAQRLLGALPPRTAARPRKLYVSRKHAAKRRLANEAEIERVLAPRGFETVYTERLTVAEQAALFQQAEAVVSLHGAGLANLLFMQEGRLVVELVPHRRAKTCYVSLARAMGLRYACITDAPEAEGETATGQGHQPDVDVTIPVERLAKALDALGV